MNTYLSRRTRALLAVAFALLGSSAHAGVVIYNIGSNGGLVGFTAATGAPIAIDFDSIAPNTNITGNTISGVTFAAPGSPLIVVDGNATATSGAYSGAPNPASNKLLPTSGRNVLSPGGASLLPGPNAAVENDDLELTFTQPLSAFGFDHISQSADGASFTNIQVFNQANALLFSGTVPISNLGGGGAPAGADFWGVRTTGTDLIGRILINESDGNAVFPDNNIGFDSFRFFAPSTNVPDSSPVLALGATLLALAVGSQRRRRG